jgi:uncharacterized SAM-binding protein YcdF (DUF218 family)
MELGFLLKKLISIFIKPMSVALILLFIGLVLLYKDKIKLSKKALSLGFVVLLLFSYNPVSHTLLKSLENQYPKLEKLPANVEHILLLGGDLEKRGWELLRLYHQNKELKVITSGYEGKYDIPEAIRTANILIELGIPKKNIITHPKVKDTKEEAMKIKELLGDKPFVLVTAAYHMPRAMALFQKEGTNPVAAPASIEEKKMDFFSFPGVDSLYNTQIALHEYIGLLWAKLRGQI